MLGIEAIFVIKRRRWDQKQLDMQQKYLNIHLK